MAQAPILGAGGIVVRGGDKPLIAVVQRRKDDGWVLPKGKLKRNESAIAGAEREVREETGQDVIVHEFLGAISFTVSGKPKCVQFWRMEATNRPARKLTKDIKAVKWLPLESAIKKLDDPLEQLFLRNVAERALASAQPIAVPVAATKDAVEPAVAEPARQPIAIPPAAEQPTALTLPLVEPSFGAAPVVRKEHLSEQPAPISAEPLPKPNVLPTPPAQPVVLATPAPRQEVLPPPPHKPAVETLVPLRPAMALAAMPKPVAPPPVQTDPAPSAVTKSAMAPAAPITRSATAPLISTATAPVVTKPLPAPAVVARPAAEPALVRKPAPPPVPAKPAPQAIPERSTVIPPIAEPRVPSNLFGRVLQRLQLDWTDPSQRRHWTTGSARRTGR